MYTVLIVVLLLYIWRIYSATKKGFVEEVENLSLIVMISVGVIAAITCLDSVINRNLIAFLITGIVLLALLIARKIIRSVFSLLGLLAKLPIIRRTNRLLGFAIGILEATMLAWGMLAILSRMGLALSGMDIISQIENNTFLMFLYEHNFLQNLMGQLIDI